jgi:tetratricopeptide (TPR) repeat protein
MSRKVARPAPVRLFLYLGLLAALAAALTARLRWQREASAAEHDRLGMGYFNQGNLAAAAVELRREIAVAPERALAHYKLGIIELQQGHPQEAREALQRAIALGVQQPHASCALGLAAFRLSEYSAAVAPLRRCLAGNPGDDDARYLLAASFQGQARWEEAEQAFRELLLRHPNDGRLLASLGTIYLYRASTPTNNAAALAVLHRATALREAPAGAFYSLALVCRRAGRWEEAATALEAALRRDPRMIEARFALGSIYRHLGKEAMAGEQFHLARARSAAAQQDRRLTYLRGEVMRNTLNPMVHFQLGCLEEELKDDTGARHEFEAAAALDPHMPDPHARLAEIAERQGKPQEARRYRALAEHLTGEMGRKLIPTAPAR